MEQMKRKQFQFTPKNAKKLNKFLTEDNYLTYALCLAHNTSLTEEQKEEYHKKMLECYEDECNSFKEEIDVLEDKKEISNDNIEESISNE
jgi:hypothetical protein